MRAGDVVWNPLSGEKALLVGSAEESGGARIVVDFAVEAGEQLTVATACSIAISTWTRTRPRSAASGGFRRP